VSLPSAADYAWPAPDPLPIPTIAWRVIHLAAWTDVYRHFAFGDTRPDLREFDVPGDVNAGLACLYRAQDDFTDAVDGLSDESAFELRPAHWCESRPVVNLVTLMLTEHVHHIAEVGVLRDLHRGCARLTSCYYGRAFATAARSCTRPGPSGPVTSDSSCQIHHSYGGVWG
jgi:DinB superfamily